MFDMQGDLEFPRERTGQILVRRNSRLSACLHVRMHAQAARQRIRSGESADYRTSCPGAVDGSQTPNT